MDMNRQQQVIFDKNSTDLLFVERKKVIDLYATMDKAFPREAAYSVQSALQALFGDKCLPDTPNPSNSGELKSQNELEHRLEQTSVQGEPRFRIGDKVLYGGVVRTIGHISATSPKCRLMNGDFYGEWVNESELEPYAEPETKDNTQQSSWEAEFKKMNECFEKIQKTLSSLYETWGKIEDGINKLNRL